MESLFIRDFRLGLDTRRSELTQRPGTLEVLTNGFINQGGEIENRKAFVRTAQIANSFGLQTTSSGLLTFGSANNPGGYPLDIGPTTVNYQQLKHPQDLFDGTTNVVAMTEVVYSTEYRGKAVVFAKFGSSGTYGYYDGVLMKDFTDGLVMSHLNTNDKIAQAIDAIIDATNDYTSANVTNVDTITGPVGQSYDLTVSDTSAGTLAALKQSDPIAPSTAKQAIGSFEIVAGSSSAGTNKISQVEVNSVVITNAAVDWTTSNEVTAGLLAASINTKASTPEYTAEATGAIVTIKATLADGDTPNNYVVKVTAAGNVCVGRVQFQILRSNLGSFANVTGVTIAGVQILTASIPWVSSTSQLATDVAADVNANTTAGTAHGYICCAIGSYLFFSKAVTASSDPYLPIYISTDASGNGNGVFEVGTDTTGVGILAALITATGPTYTPAPGGYNWKWTVTLNVTGGYPPYQEAVWYGGSVTRIDATHFTVTKYSQNTPNNPPLPPAVYCTVKDSVGAMTTSNSL